MALRDYIEADALATIFASDDPLVESATFTDGAGTTSSAFNVRVEPADAYGVIAVDHRSDSQTRAITYPTTDLGNGAGTYIDDPDLTGYFTIPDLDGSGTEDWQVGDIIRIGPTWATAIVHRREQRERLLTSRRYTEAR